MQFLMFFCALLGLAAFGGIAWYMFQRDHIRAVVCGVTAMFLTIGCIAFGDAYASSLGFKNKAEMDTARAAGIVDPSRWAEIRAQEAREKQIKEGLDTATMLAGSMVRESLKDPWSASIQTRRARFVNNHVVACGTVNAKNGFGAYTGEKMFVVQVDTRSVIVEGMDGAWQEDWRTDCG